MSSNAGLVFDIKHFAVHDGPGIRTTVFLKGCPLRCAWCHNPEGESIVRELALVRQKCIGCGDCVRACPNGVHTFENGVHLINRSACTLCGACAQACCPGALVIHGREMTVEELMKDLLPDSAFYSESGGGITVSGGEPLMQPDFCAALLQACRREGLHTALDTSGAVPWRAFEHVLPFTDLVLFDVKMHDSEQHRKWTGLGNRGILENLTVLGQRNIPVEVRIPCLPGVNDGEELDRIAQFLSGIPSLTTIRLLPYHDFARSKYESLGLIDSMPHLDRPSPEQMDVLRARVSYWGLPVADS